MVHDGSGVISEIRADAVFADVAETGDETVLRQGYGDGDARIRARYLRQTRNLWHVYKLNTGGGAAKHGKIDFSTPY